MLGLGRGLGLGLVNFYGGPVGRDLGPLREYLRGLTGASSGGSRDGDVLYEGVPREAQRCVVPIISPLTYP